MPSDEPPGPAPQARPAPAPARTSPGPHQPRPRRRRPGWYAFLTRSPAPGGAQIEDDFVTGTVLRAEGGQLLA